MLVPVPHGVVEPGRALEGHPSLAARGDHQRDLLHSGRELAATTAPAGRLEAVLAEEDASVLDVADADRELFVGFGSCSWREPVEDLVELGLLS